MQLKEINFQRESIVQKPIPQDERTFLHWEDINYFVPTKTDPNVLPLNADRK